MQKNTSRQPWTKPVDTHYKNTYFFHWPWQKCLLSQIKRPFPPSPFAMLFAITKEMHTWAVRSKQRCNRGGEGGEFVPFGHEDCMARNWKLYWNVSTVLSGVVAFPFFVDMLDSIQHSVKKHATWYKMLGIWCHLKYLVHLGQLFTSSFRRAVYGAFLLIAFHKQW